MKFLRFLFSRLAMTVMLILFQFALLLTLVLVLSQLGLWIYYAMILLSVIIVVYIIAKRDNPAFKLVWVVIIMLVPIVGGLFYLFWGNKRLPRGVRERSEDFSSHTLCDEVRDNNVLRELSENSTDYTTIARYVDMQGGFPLWSRSQAEYFPLGEKMFLRLVEELEKAERFIFMEYFIVEEGHMWNTIYDILKRKVQQGVQVVFMYDDVGSISTLPTGYDNEMRTHGIRVQRFNPFHPRLSALMNYRDHRKITVVDGKVAFCGGANLADEYINEVNRFGHWKDTAVMVRGDAVWNLTETFLKLWNFAFKKKQDRIDISKYRPFVQSVPGDGFMQPFSDSPLDNENVSENTLLNIINKANHYVYITTPYLVIDNEMLTCLCLAAKNGIDVRIIVPGVPDKGYVYSVTKSYYLPLLEAGVRIYEYTPGFIHAKNLVADDALGMVGTINLDYRSLYFHFECSVLFYYSSVIREIKEDFMRTMAESHEVTLAEARAVSWGARLVRSILRVFAPLM